MEKILVFDKCIVDDSKAVFKDDPEEILGSSFLDYIESVNDGNLDSEYFKPEDVDTSVFIIDDGGELFRLKNGTYINVCWRGSNCRVWPEDDEEMIDIYNEKLGKSTDIKEDLVWTPISIENEINLALQEQAGWFDASSFTKEDRKKVAELIVSQSDKPWTSSDIRDFVLDICKEDGNWKYVLEQYDIVFDESLKEADEDKTPEEPSKEEKSEPKIISDGLGQRRADKLAAMLNEENPDGFNGPFAEEPATSEDATVEVSSQAGFEKTTFNDDGSVDVKYHWAEGSWNEETGELEDLEGEETFETLEEWISHAEENTFFLNIDLGELENVK